MRAHGLYLSASGHDPVDGFCKRGNELLLHGVSWLVS
jgi:hypothetical protein